MGLLGERFGGVWLNGSPPAQTVHVGVVAPADADRLGLVSAAAELGVTMRITPVRYSLQQLLTFHKSMGAMLHEARLQGPVAFGLKTDLNCVHLDITPRDAAIVDRIKRAIPADALDIDVKEFRIELTAPRVGDETSQ